MMVDSACNLKNEANTYRTDPDHNWHTLRDLNYDFLSCRTDLSRPLALVDDVQVPDALYKPEQ
jgi:hypothetical protein